MGRLLQVDKLPLAPVYSQECSNESIDLGSVAVEFTYAGQTYHETATATMRFLPDERLLFFIPTAGKPPWFGLRLFLDEEWDGRLVLLDSGVTLHVYCKGSDDRDGIVFAPKISGFTRTCESDQISHAVFHLFNVPDFSGPEDYILAPSQPSTAGSVRCGRMILKADGWIITIAATDRTPELTKALAAQHGYVITHVGRIEREDGGSFASCDLSNLLVCLHSLLSFALGRWTGIGFPVGFDATGARVFERWGLPLAAAGAWNGSYSWFNTDHAEIISQVFPGFWQLWHDKVWSKPISDAVYWYLAANEKSVSTFTDKGIILAQTALELLAWTYCVLDKKTHTRKDFRYGQLPAAAKLRALASSLSIPLVLRPSLSGRKQKNTQPWTDNMDALVSVRNSIIHPDREDKLPNDLYFEVWNLCLWYIEMVLLRLCGHTGKYRNRLVTRGWTSGIESVPWGK